MAGHQDVRPAATVTPDVAIEAQGLSKSFGDVRALDDVDLIVPAGIVYGLLGPNGAGKTTLVKVLTTPLRADSGSARVAGHDIEKDAALLRARIGLAGQYAAVDENLTGFENLEMVGRLYHMGKRPSRERASQLLERFELADAGGRPVKTYSGGMRRRLDLAAALVARPPVLFLDEPTTGLDPRSRIGLWETIEARVEAGSTVLLTTQYLDEADRLADRVAVIDHGRVIAEGTPEELRTGSAVSASRSARRRRCRPGCCCGAGAACGRPAASRRGPQRHPERGGRSGLVVEAVRRLDAAGVEIEDIAVRRPTLDDVFLTLTGRATEEEDDEEAA